MAGESPLVTKSSQRRHTLSVRFSGRRSRGYLRESAISLPLSPEKNKRPRLAFVPAAAENSRAEYWLPELNLPSHSARSVHGSAQVVERSMIRRPKSLSVTASAFCSSLHALVPSLQLSSVTVLRGTLYRFSHLPISAVRSAKILANLHFWKTPPVIPCGWISACCAFFPDLWIVKPGHFLLCCLQVVSSSLPRVSSDLC